MHDSISLDDIKNQTDTAGLDLNTFTWLINGNFRLNLFQIGAMAGSFGMLSLYNHIVVATFLWQRILALMQSCQKRHLRCK